MLRRLLIRYRKDPMASFRHHAALFAAIAATWIGLRTAADLQISLFWPFGIWFAIATAHFCIVRSMTVSDEEADARAEDIYRRTYEFERVEDVYPQPKRQDRISRDRTN
jgi:hypothetical protein